VGEGLIIDGRRVAVPGVNVVSWLDDPRVPKAVHGAPRSSADVVASIVHTSRGKDARVTRETGSPAKGLRVARYLGRANSRQVSAHLVVAGDGTVYQIADIGAWRCNHAGAVNGWTWGLEAAQDDDDPSLTRAQVNALVAVMHVAHDALRIPKFVPVVAGRHVSEDVVPWLSRKSGGAGKRFAGAVGHRCVSTSRGKGDPGDAIMEALRASGFTATHPFSMTLNSAPSVPAAPVESDDPDEMHDGDDAPAWPPLPAWVDAAREVDASHDLTDDIATMVRSQWEVLRGQGLAPAQAAELLAHAATETGRGRRAHGHNWGGVKLKRDDDEAHRAKHGRGLAWWRDLGHLDAGDDEAELYRAWDSDVDFWAFFAKRYAPRPGLPAESERYEEAGGAFWSGDPSQWFVELVRAGYRGPVRQRELAALADPETHPSVVAHRRLVARVRGLLA
jgi:hypothetical protein